MKNKWILRMIGVGLFSIFVLLYPEYILLPESYEYVVDGKVMKDRDAHNDFYEIISRSNQKVEISFPIIKDIFNTFNVEGIQKCQKQQVVQSESLTQELAD